MVLFLACTEPSDSPLPFDDTEDTAYEPEPLDALSRLGFTNIVFIHADTLRQDRLPMYGSEHDTLPTIGGLPWLVVDGVHADTSWTIPSTISVLTGLDDLHHGFTHMTSTGAMSAAELEHTTFAERLHDAGYATVALVGNQALPMVEGIYRGFDVVDPTYTSLPKPDIEGEVSNLLPWLDTLPPEQPFFAFLQPMDMHLPYRPHPDYAGTWSDSTQPLFPANATEDEQLASFQALYEAADAEERQRLRVDLDAVYDELALGVDEGVAALIEGLAARGLASDTLVVLAGDHGETLAEEPVSGRVYFGHGGTMRQELVRVPLMMYHPAMRAEHVDCLAQNTDVFPTLLAALRMAEPDGLDGHPLQGGCRTVARSSAYNSDVDARVLSELMVSDGVSTLRWVCDAGYSLRYDLTNDPLGVDDIRPEDFPQGAALQTEMEAWVGAVRASFGGLACNVPEAPAP